MVLANPADPYKIETQIIGWTNSGERLEPYGIKFLKVIKTGTDPETEADAYNSVVRPISDYLDVPGVSEWQEKMSDIDDAYEVARRHNRTQKTYVKVFGARS